MLAFFKRLFCRHTHGRLVSIAFDGTAVYECAAALEGSIPIIADGGIRHSGDIPKAIVAGADVVLLCTSAATPLLDVTGLPAGTLVTSISTNAPLAHEIDPAALASLDVYADHASSATGS